MLSYPFLIIPARSPMLILDDIKLCFKTELPLYYKKRFKVSLTLCDKMNKQKKKIVSLVDNPISFSDFSLLSYPLAWPIS